MSWRGGTGLRKYMTQVSLYTQYFTRVTLDSPGVLLYTVCLPVFFLVMNTTKVLFHPLTMTQFMGDVLPFVAWIVISNALVAVVTVGTLREQGYLKQYRTLVVNDSVILASQFLVTLGLLFVMLGLVGVLSSCLFRLNLVRTVGRLWGMLLLTSLPLAGFCLPLLALAVRLRTLNMLVNALLLVVMFGAWGLSAVMTPAGTNLVINLVSPIYFEINVFAALATGDWAAFLPVYVAVVVSWSIVGYWSYRHLRILPVEGA